MMKNLIQKNNNLNFNKFVIDINSNNKIWPMSRQ